LPFASIIFLKLVMQFFTIYFPLFTIHYPEVRMSQHKKVERRKELDRKRRRREKRLKLRVKEASKVRAAEKKTK
jgi:hypothetical protein